jgi:type IV secretory pathway TraG/TraD family ATPase VirD4
MEAYTEFLRNLFAFPAKFEFFQNSADWVNTHFPLLKLTSWDTFIIWICFAVFVVHGGAFVYLWISRKGMSANNLTTGRFSTSFEINQYYRIPGQLLFYSTRVGVIFLAMFAGLVITHSLTVIGVLIAAVPLFISIELLERHTDFLNFEKLSRSLKAIPLGWVGNKQVGVIGGTYWSLFKRKRIRAKQRQEHVLIVGPTGTGKTTTFFIPALIEDAHSNDSCFVIDIKDNEDLVDIVGPEWNKTGKKVICFDPWKKEERLSFNPLFYLEPDLDDPETYYTTVSMNDTFRLVITTTTTTTSSSTTTTSATTTTTTTTTGSQSQ